MKTTIAVSEEVKLSLLKLKIEERAKTYDELLKKMIVQYRKIKFLEASKKIRMRMKELNVNLEDLLNE